MGREQGGLGEGPQGWCCPELPRTLPLPRPQGGGLLGRCICQHRGGGHAQPGLGRGGHARHRHLLRKCPGPGALWRPAPAPEVSRCPSPTGCPVRAHAPAVGRTQAALCALGALTHADALLATCTRSCPHLPSHPALTFQVADPRSPLASSPPPDCATISGILRLSALLGPQPDAAGRGLRPGLLGRPESSPQVGG